jgi:ribosomal protein S13
MSEKNYLILLDIDARKRHHHVSEAGRIIKFVVQLEIKIGEEWKEVIRYDCVHGYAHKDFYNIRGQHKKINLRLDYEDTLTMAEDDINENWEIYRENFLKGDFPRGAK